jgi:hypothetical protein
VTAQPDTPAEEGTRRRLPAAAASANANLSAAATSVPSGDIGEVLKSSALNRTEGSTAPNLLASDARPGPLNADKPHYVNSNTAYCNR